MKMEAIDF